MICETKRIGRIGGRMQRMTDTVSKMDMSAHPQVTELIEWRKAYDES